ncbi:MarR family winged helix-turn-helix transcriptional regulator [Agromyces sp. SYSU T00194]|uniref:MarR family winged helix-turn-helix transcriptional regulator n=1 Tax=Agromyces chitinivorans TaxID=3158560 RepID=UPI0033951FA1
MAGDASIAEQGRLVLATEAVAALVGREEPATVNAVADEIGIDQSGASRLVKSAVDAGYVTLVTNPTDGRRREVAVTPRGRAVLRQAHAWQERVFDELTTGWTHQRRVDFQTAMADLIARSHTISG